MVRTVDGRDVRMDRLTLNDWVLSPNKTKVGLKLEFSPKLCVFGYKNFLGFYDFFKIFKEFLGFYMIFKGFKGFYRIFQDFRVSMLS